MSRYLIECFNEKGRCLNISMFDFRIAETEIFSGVPDHENMPELEKLLPELNFYFIFEESKYFITDETKRDMLETKNKYIFENVFKTLGTDEAAS